MIIEIPISSYNHRRYGKPWGAKITFSGVKPVYDFVGHYDGSSVVIDAEPGDIVAHGQRDHRGHGTWKYFQVVQDDGTLGGFLSEAECRHHYLSRLTTPAQMEA